MKKKIIILLTVAIVLIFSTLAFANDENPGPKHSMPQRCHEHHIINCPFCD